MRGRKFFDVRMVAGQAHDSLDLYLRATSTQLGGSRLCEMELVFEMISWADDSISDFYPGSALLL